VPSHEPHHQDGAPSSPRRRRRRQALGKRYGDRYLFAVYLTQGEAERIASMAAARDVPRTVVLREAVRMYLSVKASGS
jgi:hypothetical protein